MNSFVETTHQVITSRVTHTVTGNIIGGGCGDRDVGSAGGDGNGGTAYMVTTVISMTTMSPTQPTGS